MIQKKFFLFTHVSDLSTTELVDGSLFQVFGELFFEAFGCGKECAVGELYGTFIYHLNLIYVDDEGTVDANEMTGQLSYGVL
jgi:hypothetical protein